MMKPIDYNSRYINTRNINMINIGTQWEIPLIDPQIRVASTKHSASIAQRRAFSLIELLVVVSVIGLLVSLALPAVQRVRESSRQVVCLNNLKQLVVAVAQYESSYRRYPRGTNGFLEVIPNDGGWNDPTSRWFWQRVPNTSSIAHMLPMLDHDSLYKMLPDELIRVGEQTDPVTWYGELPGVVDVMNVSLPFLLCPSDSLESGVGGTAIMSCHPSVDFSTGRDWSIDMWIDWLLEPPGATNYVGCVGAHSGENQVIESRVPYRGAMVATQRMRSSLISDGLSHTVLFGENIGRIQNYERLQYHSWLFSGLARGRSVLPWGEYVHPTNPDHLLLGDAAYAYIVGFGAMHPGVVQFSFADGSVRAINRRIDLWTLYALCGIEDGHVLSADEID